MAQVVVRVVLVVIVIFDLNSNAQNVGTDIHLESPQCSVVTKILDDSLTSPPECPAPSLEHVLDQHHALDKNLDFVYMKEICRIGQDFLYISFVCIKSTLSSARYV